MIHSPQVVDRIVELIKLSGISKNDIIEEMTDHYLSEIEEQIIDGASNQTAIRNVYQNIALLDLSEIKSKNSKSKIFIFILFGIVLSLFTYCLLTSSCHTLDQVTSNSDLDVAPTAWPLTNENFDITSTFGYINHPVTKTLTLHNGIDIKASIGTPVLSTGNAIVLDSGYNTSSGYYIILKHNNSYSTRYNHLSKIDVKSCQKVKQGDQIGLVGSSGMSLIPHLHYEILKDHIPIDPISLIAP